MRSGLWETCHLRAPVEVMGLEPTNLLHAMQALYQLSYTPEGRSRYQRRVRMAARYARVPMGAPPGRSR
jgi:hypothetical protein